MAYWRVAIMGAVLGLLATAIVNADHAPVAFFGVPALCFFIVGYSYVITTVLLTFLFFSYITGVVRLFNPLSRQTHRWFRIKPGNLLKRMHRHAASRQAKAAALAGKGLWRTCKVSLTFLYVVFKTLYEIGGECSIS